MIAELTGGGICYAEPVNHTGLLVAIICVMVMYITLKWSLRN